MANIRNRRFHIWRCFVYTIMYILFIILRQLVFFNFFKQPLKHQVLNLSPQEVKLNHKIPVGIYY